MFLSRWADRKLRDQNDALHKANEELRAANKELHDANADLMDVQIDLAGEQDRIREACGTIGVSLPPRVPLPASHMRRKQPSDGGS